MTSFRESAVRNIGHKQRAQGGSKKVACARGCARGTKSGTGGHNSETLCPERELASKNKDLCFCSLCPRCARNPYLSLSGTSAVSLDTARCARLDGRGVFSACNGVSA